MGNRPQTLNTKGICFGAGAIGMARRLHMDRVPCIPMTIKAKGRVRGKGLTRHLAGSFPPASEKKLGWMTPSV